MKVFRGTIIALMLLFCSAVVLSSQSSIGISGRLGPYSFITAEVACQYDITERLSAAVAFGPAADLQIKLFEDSQSSGEFDALEASISLRGYLHRDMLHPYLTCRIAGAFPLRQEREFLLYSTFGAGTEIQISRLFFGAEGGSSLTWIGEPEQATDGFITYGMVSLRFEL